jgi:23S rRNA pseudouridine955/2504/2580 synthase
MRAARPHARFLELVHRLDRDTSGCLLIAKKRSSLRQLQQAFRERWVEKRYLALVRGPWRGGARAVAAPLRRRVVPSGERVVGVHCEGKPAVTSLRPLQAGVLASLLEARTLTGRMHQIRAHAMVAGYPLAGDAKYGDREFNRAMREHGLRRLFLHASSITCRGADGATLVRVAASLPAELRACLTKIGLDWHDTDRL